MVGQEATRQTLLAISQQNKFAHAYLFCGTRGTGKTTSARILAKAINCINRTSSGDPCEQCDMCKMADAGKMTDIIEIDAASNRGIDEVRDLIEKVAFQPNFGKAKIYIIDEVHMMTKEAFNALLKTLEEPPSHAFFILATTEFHKVPETIRSRCQTYFFRNISVGTIISRLEYICAKENIAYDIKGLEMIAKRASGGLRDAISLLEQSSSYGAITEENLRNSLGIISDEMLKEFFQHLCTDDTHSSFYLLQSIQQEGRSLEEFAKDFLWFLRTLFQQSVQEKKSDISFLLSVIELFQTALQRSKQFAFPSLAFEMAIAEVYLLKHPNTHAKAPLPIAPLPSVPVQKAPESPIPTTIKETPSLSSTPPWEDEMLPPSPILQKETPIVTPATTIPKTSIPTHSGAFDIFSEWSKICDKMPKSIRINLLEYATVIGKEENIIRVKISTPSTKTLLENEKNKAKIEEVLSEYIGTPTNISFESDEESGESLTPDDIESLFRF